MHRGSITVAYPGGESQCVGSRVSYSINFNYKRKGTKYTFEQTQKRFQSVHFALGERTV